MTSILRQATVVLMSLVVAACSTPSPSNGPWAASPAVEPEAPAVTTPSSSTGSSPSASAEPTPEPTDPPIADEPPPLALETVAGGLDAPINVTATRTGWLLVNERRGRVVAVNPDRGDVAVALDITDRVLGEGERGLLGLALHPDWPAEPRAFIHYTDRDGDTVLSEFRDTSGEGEAPTLDPGSERVLLQLDQPYANHNGGQLAFGPDRLLYLGLGDGGSAGDPEGNGQDPTTLLGSILRIDVDDIPDDGNDAIGYGIPADNPFADGDGGAPEVFVYGLRNPWRFSFDRATGKLWIADVGQNAYEEIDRLDPAADAGANLGWSVMEASQCFSDPACSSDGFVMPVSEYGRDLGCSVTGGHVYRGTRIRDLRGWYVFGDYCSGLVLGIRSDVDELAAPRVLLESGVTISTFGEGADGELYLADIDSGTLYRLVPGG